MSATINEWLRSQWATEYFLPYGRHPLQDLLQGENIEENLQKLPPEMQHSLHGHVYQLATDRTDEWEWGKKHIADDPQRLKLAISLFANGTLKNCRPEERNALYGTIYELAGSPKTVDLQWGEHHATEDTTRLIKALNRQGLLGGGKKVHYYEKFEKESRFYDLQRKELPKGRIGYINGMNCPFEYAKGKAERFSTEMLEGYNLHCVHAATQGRAWDVVGAALTQKQIPTRATRLLHQRWQEFFEESKPDERFLQICHSRGAIDVFNALHRLPQSLRDRIIVIALAPAYIIPKEYAHKVFNYIIPDDPVPYLAPNCHLIEEKASEVIVLPTQLKPHDPLGPSYKSAVEKQLAGFLKTGKSV